MFGPNRTPSYHHDEPAFFELMQQLDAKFRERFKISDEFGVVFVPGSGTLGLEMVLWSLGNRIVWIPSEQRQDKFGRRLYALAAAHKKGLHEEASVRMGVHYETSISRFNGIPKRTSDDDLIFLDCVSSFPYYRVPKDVDVWVTVSGKQLCSDMGLAIIVFRKSKLGYFKTNVPELDDGFSSLSILRAWASMQEFKPHHSPAFSLLQSLLNRLTFRVWTKASHVWIDERRDYVEKIVGKDAIIGTGPVVTFREGVIPQPLIDKYGIYARPLPQLFLWSTESSKFFEFLDELKVCL